MRSDGRRPFDEWFDDLPPSQAVIVDRVRGRFETQGAHGLNAVGGSVREWRDKSKGPGLRIYLAEDGQDVVILLGGGTKRHQQDDIDDAVAAWADYKKRKAAARKEQAKAEDKRKPKTSQRRKGRR